MKKLLVPLNFSSDYQNVLRYATSLAAKAKAELTIFFVGGRKFLKAGSTITFHQDDDLKAFFERIKENELGSNVKEVVTDLLNKGIYFCLKSVNGSLSRRITNECNKGDYDLIIMGTDAPSGLRGYLQNSLTTDVLNKVQAPVFVVPAKSEYNDIENITYAVDLSAYDPKIIRQIKSIASLFDAKLTIAHVNQEEEDGENAEYLRTLEQTITDTLDYPKVYYKFFDHTDIIAGIKKFISLNNSSMVAMISRKESSWKDIFSSEKSLTRKMAQDLKVPLLAFRK